MAHADVRIVRNDRDERFELADAPESAYLRFERTQGQLTLVHTEVADELEGRGVASTLVRDALAHARREGLTVAPQCPFVAGWLDRHPEHAEQVDIAGR